jgi:hypothetical protein
MPLTVSAVCAVSGVVWTLVYFRPTIVRFLKTGGGNAPAKRVQFEAQRWILLNWIRVAMVAVSWWGVFRAHNKVSSWLRAAQRRVGPSAGPLVPADPPRSPEGKLLVYVDCDPLGVEQIAALEQAGLSVDGVDFDLRRVRGSIDDVLLDRVAAFSWVHAVRPVDRAVVRVGSTTTEGDSAGRADLLRAQGLNGSGVVVGVISDGIIPPVSVENSLNSSRILSLSVAKAVIGSARAPGGRPQAILRSHVYESDPRDIRGLQRRPWNGLTANDKEMHR